jgi:hypothetical protein
VFVMLHGTAGSDLNEVDGVLVGVDEFREIAGGNLFDLDIGEVLENAGVHRDLIGA